MTGGANGLGRAISVQLAKQGCHVAIADADYDAAIQTRNDLRTMGVKAEAYHVNNFFVACETHSILSIFRPLR